MMPAKPRAPRYTSEDLGNALLISIPSRKTWKILFFGIWSAVWISGGIFAIVSALRETVSVREIGGWGIFFSIFWFIFSLLGIYHFLWQLAGKEEIEIIPDSIQITEVILLLRRSKQYISSHIKDLRTAAEGRIEPYPPADEGFSFNKGTGIIAFDYEGRMIRMGIGIDEAEGRQIIAEIHQRYPQYKK